MSKLTRSTASVSPYCLVSSDTVITAFAPFGWAYLSSHAGGLLEGERPLHVKTARPFCRHHLPIHPTRNRFIAPVLFRCPQRGRPQCSLLGGNPAPLSPSPGSP